MGCSPWGHKEADTPSPCTREYTCLDETADGKPDLSITLENTPAEKFSCKGVCPLRGHACRVFHLLTGVPVPSQHHSVDQSCTPGDAGLGAALGGEDGSVRRSEYLWSHCMGRRPDALHWGLVGGGRVKPGKGEIHKVLCTTFSCPCLKLHGSICNQHEVY